MIENLRGKFLFFFALLAISALLMLYTLHRSLYDNKEMIRFEKNIAEPLNRIASLALDVESHYMFKLLPEDRRIREISKQKVDWQPKIGQIFTYLRQESRDDPALQKSVSVLEKDWNRFIRSMQKENKIGDAIIDNSTFVLVRYVTIYNAFRQSLEYNRKEIFSHFLKRFTQNQKFLTKLFYFAAFVFVISFFFMTTILYKINHLNKKLQENLYDKEAYQTKLNEANAKLSHYSEKLEKEVQQRTQEALEHLLYHPLTKLPNRTSFLRDTQNFERISVALFDIDDFGTYNDLFGSEVGDQIIKAYAKFLRESISPRYTLYHLQGDQFAIVETDPTQYENFKKSVEEIAHKVHEFHYIDIHGDFLLHLSIGVAIDRPDALTKAEIALKEAKKSGKLLVIYSDKLDRSKHMLRNITMIEKLNRAIGEERIVPYLQPVADIKTGRIVKYEILARMIDEKGDIHLPQAFIDLAKTLKLYPKITQIIFDKAIEVAQKHHVDISVNITTEDIQNHDTRVHIVQRLAKSEVASYITLEVAETEKITNLEEFSRFLKHLQTLGAHVAIDDFGSGCSNIFQILTSRIDCFKFDGSLIGQIDTNEEAKEIIKGINELAHDLKIHTAAKFVRSREIFDIVRGLGIDYAQGSVIGDPKSVEETFAS